jgi:hypothetical protein
MTSLAPKITALTVAAAIAAGAVLDAGAAGPADPAPTALVIDAALGQNGRELVDPRLEDVDAEVRLPRTASEARTNVRYFDELGYRVVVAGRRAVVAAAATGVPAVSASGLPAALDAAPR